METNYRQSSRMRDKTVVALILAVLNSLNRKRHIYESLVGYLRKVGKRMLWTRSKAGIGWVTIKRRCSAHAPDFLDDVLEELRDVRGLIVDVRSGSGKHTSTPKNNMVN